jgi:elongation factor P--(R)-beta-lysine ligase
MNHHIIKSKLRKITREFFHREDYLEVETPIVVSCPGTELHLDYFETTILNFEQIPQIAWLRSSPEIHLKKLLACGYSRIFELARCFRNCEEKSSWHHHEFNLLEWYQEGISFDNFMQQTYDYLKFCYENLKIEKLCAPSFSLPNNFLKISIYEAFNKYCGFDLIDLDPDIALKAKKNDIYSVKVTDDFETAFFKILLEKIEPELKTERAIFLYDYPPSQAALAKIKGNRAKRFELYIDGIELCNAFLEETDPRENRIRIQETNKKRQALRKPIPCEDEDFYSAIEAIKGKTYCGNALGFDRWLSILMGDCGLKKINI